MSGHGPYFIDPELAPNGTTDAQMYALADGALQAHQEQHQLAGLVQAATAAADEAQQHDGRSQTKRGTRKRKRGQQSGENDAEEPVDEDQEQHVPSSASALFRRPSSTAKKYTRPPMSKLFSSLQLTPEDFLQLQSAAKGYMLDSAHPERQDTVGQRGRGDSELVKLRLFNCVKDFLENYGNGVRYFGPDVPGDEGQRRTMIWPQDKNDIIGAVIPLMRRMVTNERQRQYAVESRKGGREFDDTNGAPDSSQAIAGESQGDKSLFETFTGCDPKDYVVGPTYDWPMLQFHIGALLPKMGLPEHDAQEVTSSLSYHLRFTHREGFTSSKTMCSISCISGFLDNMIESGKLDHGTWTCTDSDTIATKRKRRVRPMLEFAYPNIDRMKSILKELAHTVSGVISKDDPALATRGQSKGKAGKAEFPIMLQISLVRNGERLRSRRDISSSAFPYHHTILQDAAAEMGPSGLGAVTVKALCPEGLVTVKDDAAWQRCVKVASETEWMDGEMKVIVELS